VDTPKRRGKLDYIPALAGLPDDQQKQLYKDARNEVFGSWQMLGLVALYILAIWVVWELKDTIYASRWNPGVPRPIIYAVLIAAVVFAWQPVWRWFDLHIVAPRIWRRLPHICNGCGYDLTGNTSGRCPECGGEYAGEA
jgi:hypothetical protein